MDGPAQPATEIPVTTPRASRRVPEERRGLVGGAPDGEKLTVIGYGLQSGAAASLLAGVLPAGERREREAADDERRLDQQEDERRPRIESPGGEVDEQ